MVQRVIATRLMFHVFTTSIKGEQIMFGGGIGMQELMVILVIALLIFGPKKLPDIGRGLGRAIRDFRKSVSGLDDIDEIPGENHAERKDKK